MNKEDSIFQDLIQQLNVATFKLDDDLKCSFSGKIPKWFDDLKLNVDKESRFEIEILFPFYVVFGLMIISLTMTKFLVDKKY